MSSFRLAATRFAATFVFASVCFHSLPAYSGPGCGDADGDLVDDCIDNCPGISNPAQDDTDFDGTGDACDLCPNDAYDFDYDGDAICPANDNCDYNYNPGQENSDADSYGDACDNCVGPGTDYDSDGVCSVADVCPDYYDPAQADGDSDGVGDICDNCPADSNPLQEDADFDYVGDACDACPGDTDYDYDGVCDSVDNCAYYLYNAYNPGQENSDADSYGDTCDNCPLNNNEDQADADFDQIGDVCDACPSDYYNDDDSDGICYLDDNCPDVSNVAQTDTDGDDVGDVCDNCVSIQNDDQSDCDGDGTGNACSPDADIDGTPDACDRCPGVDDDNLASSCPKLYSIEAYDPFIDVISTTNGQLLRDTLVTPGPGVCIDYYFGNALAVSPVDGKLYAVLQQAGGDCAPDPTRTLFAGCDDYACGDLSGQASCEAGWQVGEYGTSSCYYDGGTCYPCNQYAEDSGDCTNTCDVNPPCADATRTDFLGRYDDDLCEYHDGDQAACEQAYYVDEDYNLSTSCWWDADSEYCRGCTQGDQEDGSCANTCASCGDPARTVMAATVDTCHQFDGNQSGCATAFALSDARYAGCWYDTDADLCNDCDLGSEYNGDCSNSCALTYSEYWVQNLVSIDPVTAVATRIATLHDNFVGLAFNEAGTTLYGLTDEDSINTSVLSSVNPGTGAVTKLGFLPGGTPHSIAFNTDDDLICRAFNEELETIAPMSLIASPVTVTGDSFDGPYGLAFDDASGRYFLADGYSDYLFSVTKTGQSAARGPLDYTSKGLAFAEATGCSPEPLETCLAAGKGSIKLSDSDTDAKDQLKWQWSNGAALAQIDLGAPADRTTYSLCIYDSTGNTDSLVTYLAVQPNDGWDDKSPKGWNYKDKEATQDGVTKLQIKTGEAGKSKVKLQAKGANIPLPSAASTAAFFHASPRVTVQLISSTTMVCYTSEFSVATRNEVKRYQAKY